MMHNSISSGIDNKMFKQKLEVIPAEMPKQMLIANKN